MLHVILLYRGHRLPALTWRRDIERKAVVGFFSVAFSGLCLALRRIHGGSDGQAAAALIHCPTPCKIVMSSINETHYMMKSVLINSPFRNRPV